jgi:division protein CdvB (Snf7/Vps24/ESCRT-III family)
MKKKDIIYQKYGGLCYYSGRPLGNNWQIDHIQPKVNKGSNDIQNLVPAIKIVNHYKRCLNIEDFRERLSTLHLRLQKLPKKTNSPTAIKKIKYLREVSELFNITEYNPFNGTFYFETL